MTVDQQFREPGYPLALRQLAATILVVLGSLSVDAREPSAPDAAGLNRAVLAALEEDGEVCAVVGLGEGPPGGSREARHAAIRRRQTRVLANLPGDAYELRYRFRSSPVIVIGTRRPHLLRALESDPEVTAIDLDQRGRGALDDSRAAIRVDEVFDDLGITGAGRVIAILDTGVDVNHPALAGSVIDEKSFLFQGKLTSEEALDDHGHGTHIAGIIASHGDSAPRGVAPGASIVAVKVLDNQNSGWVTDWAAGVDHVVQLHDMPNGIRVDAINMSLVTNALYEDACDSAHRAMTAACNDALASGIAVFAASGNAGSLRKMSLPACLSSVISVGSTGINRVEPEPKIDYCAISDFTNRNRLLDLLAPGLFIESAKLGGDTTVLSGTSQAVAHASATTLLLKEVDSTLMPGAALDLLTETGKPIDDPLSERSFPQVDALAAVGAIVSPRFDEIRCAHDPTSRVIVAFWQALSDAETIRVEVFEDGSLRETETLPGVMDQFTVRNTEPGRTYEIVLRAETAGAPGLPSSCAVMIPLAPTSWVRGDCNDDGKLDITDAITTLRYLFVGSVAVSCRAACDSNDDEHIDIADVVYSLAALFREGSLPDAPFPNCGQDPTPGPLDCEQSRCEG